MLRNGGPSLSVLRSTELCKTWSEAVEIRRQWQFEAYKADHTFLFCTAMVSDELDTWFKVHVDESEYRCIAWTCTQQCVHESTSCTQVASTVYAYIYSEWRSLPDHEQENLIELLTRSATPFMLSGYALMLIWLKSCSLQAKHCHVFANHRSS